MRSTSATVGVAVLMAASVGLSACGGSGGGSASGSGSAQPSSKTITIGLSSVLSGPSATYGNTGKGAIAYFEWANAHGGINGYKFKWVEQDNAYSSSQSVTIARDFAQNDHAFAIITEGTPPTSATVQLAGQIKTPVFAAAGTVGLFAPPPNPYAFGEVVSYGDEPLFDAAYIINNLKQPRFSLAYQNDSVGIPSSQGVPAFAAANGGSVATSVPVAITTTDFAPAAAKLKAEGTKVVLGYLAPVALAGLQKACAAIGYTPQWVTFFATQDPSYVKLAGSLSNNVFSSGWSYGVDANNQAAAQYRSALKQYYPTLLYSTFALQGWDFAGIIAQGIKQATANGAALQQSSFLKELNGFDNVQAGMIPAVSYSPDDHGGASQLAMFQIRGTSVVQVSQFIPSWSSKTETAPTIPAIS